MKDVKGECVYRYEFGLVWIIQLCFSEILSRVCIFLLLNTPMEWLGFKAMCLLAMDCIVCAGAREPYFGGPAGAGLSLTLLERVLLTFRYSGFSSSSCSPSLSL